MIALTAGYISVEGETAFYSYRGKGGKRGRRERPRPAYDALSDAGHSLGDMEPRASLWQAEAGERGITSGTFLLMSTFLVFCSRRESPPLVHPSPAREAPIG